ncbi:unnamed protein product [Auanema sp. JU1783]|nr:unnamed protein product [Auanema sp. JU1783]
MNLCLLGLEEYIQQQAQFLTQNNSTNAIETSWLNDRDAVVNGIQACSECKQLRKELQEMKQQFGSLTQLLCSFIQQQTAHYASLTSSNTCTQSSDASVPSSNSTASVNSSTTVSANAPANRKRPAGVSQPECPIALRPVPTTNNFMPLPNMLFHNINNWSWNVPPVRINSPSLTSNTEQLAGGQPLAAETKWSPSSVDSNTADKTNIDIVGLDGSESSSSSVATQHASASPDERKPFDDLSSSSEQSSGPSSGHSTSNVLKPVVSIAKSSFSSQEKRRKHSSDDYVKIIRDQQDLSEDRIAKIQIPVPEAVKCDPSFRAVSEQQIIQQMIQNKKFEETHAKESLVQLCKKLAEKRVFGAKLMSMTTVAGLNHSNYSNLPVEGIIYIQHVCRKVMGDKFAREEEFWDAFRDATKKLAARCRRVRHAKKTKSRHEEELLAARENNVKDEVSTGSPTTSSPELTKYGTYID